MKILSLKQLGLSLLVSLSLNTASPAQVGRHPHGGGPGGREIKAYVDANVQPVLLQQRQKLEAQLAAPDRAQLVTYRAQLQVLKEKGQALRQSLRPAAGSPQDQRPTLTDAQREQFYQLHQDMRGIMRSVGEMAQKYESYLQQLRDEVQPQKEKWATDIRAIALKNATPEQQQRIAGLSSQLPEHGHRHGYGEWHHFFSPVTFLLMEPVVAENSERSLGATSFYPNPVAATSQLDFELKKAGPVTVNLLDHRGNQLRTLVQEFNVEKGAHTQPLDLRDLPAGTYYYQIVADGAKETKRFVKE